MILADESGGLPEIWGGLECTVRRVGDEFFDQVEETGHSRRLSDLDRFADLGVKAVRYPVLWERTAPEGLQRADWTWADARLHRLGELGLKPIVGLVHHGNGPRSTSLVDPEFAGRLAIYARAVAERYPWVEDWNPVNEPLTTARFGGLYGLWHPHACDPGSFARALVYQCRAVVLAMAEIRKVNPQARLIQTEDLSKTHSTPGLRYQAAWENERRWLTFDLLCGRLKPGSLMWHHLLDGVDEADLEWFLENPCPPDILGLDYYVTSERHLDEQFDRYPVCTQGGNGKHRYADVEAVRGRPEGADGLGLLAGEALERYERPVAFTEIHIGGPPESRLRWLRQAWEVAVGLRNSGHDVRAVCVWSFFGSYDWDSLLTRLDGHYEAGAFDLRAPEPRPTALAAMVRDLAEGREHDHPVLEQLGWWDGPGRYIYGPTGSGNQSPTQPLRGRPLLIVGATGALGRAFGRICGERGLPHRFLDGADFDSADATSLAAAIDELRPWAVVNTGGFSRVDASESDRDRCHHENATKPAVIAAACAAVNLAFLSFSSDLVFGGDLLRPHVESDPVRPLSHFGAAKAAGEHQVLACHPRALVVRTSALFGPWDRYNFVTMSLARLKQGRTVPAAEDVWLSPTYVPDLVAGALDLLVDGETGIWHLANVGATTWHALAMKAAELAGVDASSLQSRPAAHLGWAAPRPAYSVLGSERGWILPPLDDALDRFVRGLKPD